MSEEAVTTEERPKEEKNAAEHMIPKSRFDEINGEYKKLREQLKQFEAERLAAEEAAAKEQGRFQELYEKAQSELEQVRYDSMRQRIAAEKGFPTLWGRLQGVDEAEVAADMEALLESFPKPAPPNINGSAGAAPSRDKTPTVDLGMAREEFAAVYGVPVQFVPEE
jgi:hypothetical protein